MDQPTPDPRIDDPARPDDEPAVPSSSPTAPIAPIAANRQQRTAARLQALAGADETIVAWTQGWVSREVPLHRLLGARTFDFAVLTERSLLLFSTGFFTRRARRRVYSSRLDRLTIADDPVRRGRRLRVTARQSHPLWIELNGNERNTAFADALVARGRAEET